MSNLAKNIDYTNKDYESIRASMIEQIKIKCPEWTDYKQSDAGIAIIEALAYSLDVLSYYQDRYANECFIGTAKLRKSVIALCKLIGYSAKGYYPAEYIETFKLSEPAPTGGVTIPKGFRLSTLQTETEPSIAYEVKNTVVIPEGQIILNIDIIQGESIVNEIVGSSTGGRGQTFTLKQRKAVIDETMLISVKENGVWTQYAKVDSLIDSVSTSRHYVATIDDEDITIIEFGNGAAGKIPVVGIDNISASYRICDGIVGNVGPNSITEISDGRVPLLLSVHNSTTYSVEGIDKETVSTIKNNAVRNYRTNKRAVTDQDFEDIVELYMKDNKYTVRSVQVVKGSPYTIYVYMHTGVPTPQELSDITEYLSGKTIFLDTISLVPALEYPINVIGDLIVYQNYLKSAVIDNINSVLDAYFDRLVLGQQVYLNDIIAQIKSVEGVDSFNVGIESDTISTGMIAIKGSVSII